jgi:hypothetical protein
LAVKEISALLLCPFGARCIGRSILLASIREAIYIFSSVPNANRYSALLVPLNNIWVAVAACLASPSALSIPALQFASGMDNIGVDKRYALEEGERDKDSGHVRAYFVNNFRNPIGFLGIYGLFSAESVCLWIVRPDLYENIPAFNILMYLAFGGRFISILV